MISHSITAWSVQSPDTRDGALRAAAQKLEAAFLAEMLKSAGFGESRDSFGGGAARAVMSILCVKLS